MVQKLRNILCFLMVGIWMSACGPAATPAPTAGAASTPAAGRTLTIFAAASLTESFTEIEAQFEAAHPGVKVAFNFAGSQQLAQQLAQGAPADVFASANQKSLDDAISAGRIKAGSAQVFARNRLVVIFPADNPAGLHTLADLARPGLRLVLAAKEVPVGQYSLDFLDKASQQVEYGANFKDEVLTNAMSYEENVRFVFSKVALGEADAGIVYSTDITPVSAPLVGRIDIPDPLNVVATYPLAAVSASSQPELAAAFVEYVLSPQGQSILGKYGFLPPAKP